MDLPEVIPSLPVGAVEEPQIHQYLEIVDVDQVPAVELVPDDSSETEMKSPYDHLQGHVPQPPVLPSVYLQLSTDNAVEQQDVPTTSATCNQKHAVNPVTTTAQC